MTGAQNTIACVICLRLVTGSRANLPPSFDVDIRCAGKRYELRRQGLGAEFGDRSGRTQSNEAFRRSMEALTRFLAARPATALPDFEFKPKNPARSVAGSFRGRAGTTLLFVAIAAAVAAGFYAYGRIARAPVRITPPPIAAMVSTPTNSVPSPSSVAVLNAVASPTSTVNSPTRRPPANRSTRATSPRCKRGCGPWDSRWVSSTACRSNDGERHQAVPAIERPTANRRGERRRSRRPSPGRQALTRS